MEKDEQVKFVESRKKKMAIAEQTFVQKQQVAMEAMNKKLEVSLKGDYTNKEIEHERIVLRFTNLRKDLENKHNVERIKLERAIGKHQLANKTI